MFALRQAIAANGRRSAARGANKTATKVGKRFGGDMPVPQSQNAPLWHGHDPKVVSEGWEMPTYFYYGVAAILQTCIIAFTPESSIESWARPEAEARLKLAEKGFTDFEFGKHYQAMVEEERTELWQKFADRATIPGDDDDDDDEDDDDDDDNEDDDENNREELDGEENTQENTQEETEEKEQEEEKWKEIGEDNGTRQDFMHHFGCMEHVPFPQPVTRIHDEGTYTFLRGAYTSIVGPDASNIPANPFESAFHVPYYVAYYPTMGRGIFTKQNIPNNTVVWDDRAAARFTTAQQYRKLLLSVPRHLACDLLVWCYAMKAPDSEYGAELFCDLDDGSLLNTASFPAHVNVQERPGPNGRRQFYTTREIRIGEQLLCDYGDFDYEAGWPKMGM
uniref:NADH dehydrogenase [ubiquinone] 1 beta subcomplex subunit 11, mitochondrial n=1 Tax=Craspedostauros australis TaxID=1486917 RepID=A0A7R9WUF9_9STRA|mmetsp:Transcript_21464/g.59722  ORF Transcript_21464/g.59722 Transcript_21464/m.59722 type:complete len:392 (+) Transcript_21464:196-1371(+)